MTKTIFQLLHYLSYELTSVKPELHLTAIGQLKLTKPSSI